MEKQLISNRLYNGKHFQNVFVDSREVYQETPVSELCKGPLLINGVIKLKIPYRDRRTFLHLLE